MLVGQQYGFTTPFAESPGWLQRYGDQEVSQFRRAEMIAEKWDISREDMEAFASRRHPRREPAIDEGRFEREIAPVGGRSTTDEGPRETSLEKMAGAASRWPRAAGSPPPSPRRSATPPRRC